LGAHVIAVTRTSDHQETLRSLGADETILLEDVLGLDPVDLVLELVGASHLTLAQQILAPFARVVVIGVSNGGAQLEINLHVLMTKRATYTGSTLRSRSREEKAVVINRVNETLAPLWAIGELQVPLARSFELDDVTQAYEYFAQPGKFGKVMLLVDE
jgi:NADPH:quinone reductase-like Zn-dependent oxidoreductase